MWYKTGISTTLALLSLSNQCTAPRTILRLFLLLTQIIYAPFKIENPLIFLKIKAAVTM